VAALALGAMFFCAAYLGLRSFQENATVILLLAMLAGLLALPHAVRGIRGTWQPFDPVVAFTAIVGMGYLFRSAHLLWYEHADLYHIPLDALDALDLLAVGLSLVLLGVLSFYAGYGARLGAAVGARLPVLSAEWTTGRTRFVWLLFTLIGGLVYVVYVRSAGGILYLATNMELRTESSSGMHLYYMAIRLMPIALLFRQVLVIRRPTRWARFSFRVHVATVCIAMALLGSRSWAVEILAMVLIVRHSLDRPVRMRSLVLIGAIGMLLFSMYFEYRNLTHEGIEESEIRSMDFADVELLYTGVLGGRNFDMMDNLLSIVHFTPVQLHHLDGSSYLHYFVNLVPRRLWEGKPKGVGSILAEKVYGWKIGGAPPGAIGEAYFNYGVLGIFPALFLLGLFGRIVATYARAHPRNPFAIFVLAAGCIFVLMVTRGSFYKVGSTLTMRLVPMAIGAMIAGGFRWERRQVGGGSTGS
jgi:oligosaccharide repeat unit polymerase